MNYKNLLYDIQNAVPVALTNPTAIIVPSNAQIYNIDLNTREIEAPLVLSILSEHHAETVYFLVDRFYDNMDLAETNCVVQYTIGDKSYIYAVPFCDTTTYQDKMIIPWSVSISATETAGTIRFFVRFYLVDLDLNNPENTKFTYSLSTLVATSTILKTLPQENFVTEDNDLQLHIPENYFALIDYVNNIVDNQTTYWIDV